MKLNIGLIVNKLSKLFHPAAVRDCNIDKTAKLGSGSYCIKTKIGRYSYIGDNCVVVNTTIGSFCSIAGYCCIGGGAHPTDSLSSSPVFYGGRNVFGKNFSNIPFEAERSVEIGNDVWVGEKVFIKDGITIGNGAVIGAMSIVTRDVPSYAIVGGVPARIIRYRFNENIIKVLDDLEWWNMEEENLKEFVLHIEGKQITEKLIKEYIRVFK